MRVSSGLIAVFAILMLSGAVAEAQTMARGTLTGKIVTSSVDVPANGSAAVLTTDPAGKGSFWLVLTQVCMSDDEKDVTLDGSTMGQIPLTNQCGTFVPGLAIPRGETLTFTDINANAQAGMITGVLVKK